MDEGHWRCELVGTTLEAQPKHLKAVLKVRVHQEGCFTAEAATYHYRNLYAHQNEASNVDGTAAEMDPIGVAVAVLIHRCAIVLSTHSNKMHCCAGIVYNKIQLCCEEFFDIAITFEGAR